MDEILQKAIIQDIYDGDDRLFTDRSLRNYLARKILHVPKIEDVSLFDKNYWQTYVIRIPGITGPPQHIAYSDSAVAFDASTILDPETSTEVTRELLVKASVPFETFSNYDTDPFAGDYVFDKGDNIKPQKH